MVTIVGMYATVNEVASELGVTKQCIIANYIGRGQLKGEKIGGIWLIDRKDLERFKKMERPHGQQLRFRNGRRRRK
jgi:excisionase family DNA binding protein